MAIGGGPNEKKKLYTYTVSNVNLFVPYGMCSVWYIILNANALRNSIVFVLLILSVRRARAFRFHVDTHSETKKTTKKDDDDDNNNIVVDGDAAAEEIRRRTCM